MDREPTGTVHGVGSLYRFYEVYWAPLVAGGSPLASVSPTDRAAAVASSGSRGDVVFHPQRREG